MSNQDNPANGANHLPPRRQPGETLGDFADRVLRATHATIAEMAEELRQARGDAVSANRRRSELSAELATAQERIRALSTENTKLHGQLNALATRRDPPGSYVVRSPGVYVVTADPEHGPGDLQVTKHLLKDAVVLIDPPDSGQWVQFLRNGITGEAMGWVPPESQQNAIRKAVAAWVGVLHKDDDLTAALTGEPQFDPSITGRLARLEAQAEMADRNQQLMAPRLSRLEAWARQFPRTETTPIGPNGLWLQGRVTIEPLDAMEEP